MNIIDFYFYNLLRLASSKIKNNDFRLELIRFMWVWFN